MRGVWCQEEETEYEERLDRSSPQSSGALTHRHYQAWDQTRQRDLKTHLKVLWHYVSFLDEITPYLSISTWSKNMSQKCRYTDNDNATCKKHSLLARGIIALLLPAVLLFLTHTGCGFPVWPLKLTFFAQCYWREDILLLLFSTEFQTCPQTGERAGQRGHAANESEKSALLCSTD